MDNNLLLHEERTSALHNVRKEHAMNEASNGTTIFSRQPLSTLGKLSVTALLGSALSSAGLALLIGLPDNVPLLITTAALLLVAGLVALGLRWIPLLGTLLSGILLTIMSGQPDVIYHMTHPKEGNFASFVLDTLLFAFLVVTLGATLGATVQNYWQRERHAPGWLTPVLSAVAGMVIGAILIAAIAQPAATTSASSTTPGGEPVVHMGPGNFLQSSVSVPKGSKLLLVDDGSFLHILTNGSWHNGQPQPAQEPGAPSVNNVQVNGNSIEIGPFTTAGTYHIYCTVHQGMNLTVIVS
jgi:plastocyanin